MKSFIPLIATLTCIVADVPLVLQRDYYLPHLHEHHLAYSPLVVQPDLVRTIPTPNLKYDVPFYAGVKSQYHDRDLLGQVRYGHIEPGQSHHAIQDTFGNKVGSFSYWNAEGLLKHTNYVADAAGYRVSSNDLPVDTPEVRAAKVAHLSEHAAIRHRIRRDLSPFQTFQSGDLGYSRAFPQAYPTTNLQPIVTKEGFLEETPEVVAAKADHFARVADSRARIAALQRESGNSFGRPVESVHNTFNPLTLRTVNPVQSHNSFDYFYNQHQTFTNTRTTVPQETPEILAAKAKHFAELAASKARGATLVEPFQQNPLVPIPNTQVPVQVQPTTSFPSLDYRYAKPFPHAYPTTNLQPVVTREGFLEETPEVLAAKSNHFAQHAQALNRALV